MADTDAVSESLHISADEETVFDVVSDFESYPSWLTEFSAAEVLEVDEDGRAEVVRYTASSLGIALTFTLAYTYEPDRITWQLVTGDMLHRLDGAYILHGGDDGTTLTYELEVESAVPLPGMVRRRVAGKMVKDSLKAIKRRAESR